MSTPYELSEPRQGFPFRRTVAILAAVGLGYGAVKSGALSDNRPPDYVVVPDQGEKYSSPTDTLANRITATNYANDRLNDGKPALAENMTKADVIDYDAIMRIRTAGSATALIDPLRFGQSYSVKTVTKTHNRIGAIDDPSVRKVAGHAYEQVLVGTVIQNVGFDEIEPAKADAILDHTDLHGRERRRVDHAIDMLDAQDASLKSPAEMRRDARDIRSSKIRARLLAAAALPADTSESYQATTSIYQDGTRYEKLSKGYLRRGEASYRKLSALSDTDQEDAIAHAVKAFNDLTPPSGTISVSGSAHPLKEIDIANVDGTKDVYVRPDDTGAEREKLEQFGEVFVDESAITLTFEDGSDVSDKAAEQIIDTVNQVEPLLRAAFTTGSLLSVRFIKSDDFDPYYDRQAREIVFKVNPHDYLSEDQLRSTLVHETVHALMGSERTLSAAEATAIRGACTSLSRTAYDAAETYLSLEMDALDNLIKDASATDKKLLQRLKQKINAGTIDKSMMTTPVLDGANAIYDTDCASLTFADLLTDAATELKYKNPSIYVYEFFDRYDDNKNLDTVIKSWVEGIHNYSLYKLLSESSFVKTDSSVKEYLGHPRDNADELIASVLTATICYPNELNAAYSALSEPQQRVVRQAITAAGLLIANRHPELEQFLHQRAKRSTE